MWLFYNHRKWPSAGRADAGCMGHDFIWLSLFGQTSFLPRSHQQRQGGERGEGRGERGRMTIFFTASMSVCFPSGPQPPAHPISGKSSSAALGCEREVCCYRQAGLRGLTLQQEADLQPRTGTIYQHSVTEQGHTEPLPWAKVTAPKKKKKCGAELKFDKTRCFWVQGTMPQTLYSNCVEVIRGTFGFLLFNFKSISWWLLYEKKKKTKTKKLAFIWDHS